MFCGVATALSLLGDQALYALLPLHFESLGLAPIHVGILLSANRWIRLLTNHLAERVLQHVSPRLLFVLALGVGAIVTLVYALVSAFVVLLVARLAWGLCWSFIRHVSVMALASGTALHQRGQMMGYFNGISRMGSVAGIVFGGILFDLMGYSNTLIAFFACSMLAVPFALPVSRVPLGAARHEEHASTRLEGSALLICGFSVGAVGPGLIMSTLGYILLSRYGSEIQLGSILIGVATLNGLLLGSRWLLDTVAAPVLGAWVDHLGNMRGATGFFAVGLVALGVLAGTTSLLLLAVGILVFFISGSTLNTVLAGEASKRGSGYYARFATAGDLGSACGPLIGWVLLDQLQSAEGVFIPGILLYLAGLAAARWAFVAPQGKR